jgi:glutamate N-acetyltransferase/amino-acid N-acetyltransferase
VVDDAQSSEYHQLKALLTDVATELAQRIVRDGEGATKFVTVSTEGARTEADALAVAFTVAHSPLVKTALFASDPNWGRVCMAMGRAGVEFSQSDVEVYFDDLCVVQAGVVHEAYTEAQGAAVLAQDEIRLRLVIGSGPASSNVWTSDFSYDYVRINAEYRS